MADVAEEEDIMTINEVDLDLGDDVEDASVDTMLVEGVGTE